MVLLCTSGPVRSADRSGCIDGNASFHHLQYMEDKPDETWCEAVADTYTKLYGESMQFRSPNVLEEMHIGQNLLSMSGESWYGLPVIRKISCCIWNYNVTMMKDR